MPAGSALPALQALQAPRAPAGGSSKRTCGAARVASSVSKYSRGLKLNMPAMTFVGTVWSALSYDSTVSL